MSTPIFPAKTRPPYRLSHLPPHWWEIGAVTVIVLATLAINSRMIRYGLNGQGDLRWHITWIQHFSRQIAEGILYPRWLAGTNFGYGSPTFVFYPPLVYYIASAFRLLGLPGEPTLTAAFTLAILLSGLSFYLYGRSKWNRLGALGGALFYMTCPYLFGVLNGGALAAQFAFAWIPVGVWIVDRAIARPRWRVALAFLWMSVAVTHTPSLLIYAIAGGLYTTIVGLRRSARAAISALVFMALGLGMASFYLLPVILEQRFTNVGYVVAFYPHFLNFWALFRQNFGDPFFRELSILAILASIAWFYARGNPRERWRVAGALLAIGITLFLLSDGAGPIWQVSSTLRKLERPPRIIVIFYFGAACIYTMAIDALSRRWRAWKVFLLTLIAGTILSNLVVSIRATAATPTLHTPTRGKVFIREWLETSLFDPYSDKLIDAPEYRPALPTTGKDLVFTRERYSDAGSPLTSAEDQKRSPLPVPRVGEPPYTLLDGRARVEIENWQSYYRRLKVAAATPATLRVRLYYFPAWRLTVNGQPRPLEMADDGTVLVKLEAGDALVELSHQPTGALLAGGALSLGSLAIVLGYGFLSRGKTAPPPTEGAAPPFPAHERPNSRER